jgi:hypothetical protein
MQGMVLTMAPTINFCSCTCGSTMSSAVSSDSDMNALVLQAATAGACNQAACHTAFPTTCAAVGANGYVGAQYVPQATLQSSMDFTAVSVPSGAGSICVLISLTCAPSLLTMGCQPFMDGLTLNIYDNINATTVEAPDTVATSCAGGLAQAALVASNLNAAKVCNTNNCNVLTSDTSAAQRAHTVAAAAAGRRRRAHALSGRSAAACAAADASAVQAIFRMMPRRLVPRVQVSRLGCSKRASRDGLQRVRVTGQRGAGGAAR